MPLAHSTIESKARNLSDPFHVGQAIDICKEHGMDAYPIGGGKIVCIVWCHDTIRDEWITERPVVGSWKLLRQTLGY